MALSKYKLGELIEQSDLRNKEKLYDENSVVGISTQKSMIKTKADLEGVNLSGYKIVPINYFAYVPDTSRRGDKISLAFNNTNETVIVSSISYVFKIKEICKHIILPYYLFMYFNRPEFDRYSRFNSWGSAREAFSWDDMCDIDIELPDLQMQQKYVDIYLGMVANQQSYERGLDDLKLTCDGYIEDLRRNMPSEPIGKYVHSVNDKNSDGKITLEQGININKVFITPQRSNDNFYVRKIVRNRQIAYCTQLNNKNVAVALRNGADCIVSNVYDVVEVNNESELLPEYLMLWLVRAEFGRFVYWASQGTSYEFLSYENLAGYKIPIPDIKVQQAIADIYKVYIERKEINEKLKSQIKSLCPILIKGSLEEKK